jgi:hypothetical protein
MKKAIAKHILWLFGLVAVWFGINYILHIKKRDDWLFRGWRADYDYEGGTLLLTMLIAYVVVFLIYWSVRSIWFDKEKD